MGEYKRHGLAHVPEYKVWKEMKARCSNPNRNWYHLYGGRGITVCDQWLNDFSAFYADMGPRPRPEYSIDRINNDLGYSKDNCRWATPVEQSRNMSTCRKLDYQGRLISLAELVEITGIPQTTIVYRLNKGESPEQIATPEIYTFNGKSFTLKEWANDLGISYKQLYIRVKRYGWSIENALSSTNKRELSAWLRALVEEAASS